MKALNLFLKFDIYGIKPSFTIHGDKRFRTVIGSLCSIITYLIIIIFFIIYLKGVLLHFHPKLITTIYNDFNPKSVNLSNENFIITLSLQTTDYSNYINESIYYVNASLSSTILINETSSHEIITPLNLIKCSEYNFYFLKDYFLNLPLKDLYCLNISNIEIKGAFKTPIWNVLYFKFSKCINSTQNNNSCQSNETIDKYLKGGYIGIFLSDYIIEPNNFKNPSQYYGKNVFTTFTYKEYVDYWIYLKHEEVITDIGYFFERKNTKFYFAIDEVEKLTDYREDKNIFLNVGIRKSLKREVYERGYVKLQEAAANACGIIRVVIFCGEIFSFFFQKLLYYNFIIQFITFSKINSYKNFIFNVNNSNNQLLRSYYCLNNELTNSKNKNILSINNYSIYKRKVILKTINNSCPSTPNKKISHNFHNYNLTKKYKNVPFKYEKKIMVSHILCHKNCIQKVKYIYNKYNKIEYCFDIIQYLKLQYEIGLLKNCFFDEEKNKKIKEIYLFEYYEFTEKEGYDKIFKNNKVT